jgi:cell division protein FtsW (lipid II flippase)
LPATLVAFGLLIFPALLIAMQPDLGTAPADCDQWMHHDFPRRSAMALHPRTVRRGGSATPALWYFMHEYQRNRVCATLSQSRVGSAGRRLEHHQSRSPLDQAACSARAG